MTDETVKLHITIDIRTEDDAVDTGLSINEWNALTDAERQEIAQEMWDAMADNNGGTWVVTDGATDL
jgi:hypothetical protein